MLYVIKYFFIHNRLQNARIRTTDKADIKYLIGFEQTVLPTLERTSSRN